jgi:hypothetical protein
MRMLSIAVIPLLVIPLAWELSPSAETTFLTFDWFIWAAFAVEYGIRLYLSPSKWAFVKSNKIGSAYSRPMRSGWH